MSLKIFFYSSDGVGHINACVGLAQALAKRGHKIYFFTNEPNKFNKFGFIENLLRKPESKVDGPKINNDESARKKKAEFMLNFLSDKSPLEKLKSQASVVSMMMQKNVDSLAGLNPQIEEAIKGENPDLIIVDNFLIPPAVSGSDIPWIYLFSGNPLNLYQSDKLPPFGGGFAIDADPKSWTEFKELHESVFITKVGRYQAQLNARFNFLPQEDEQKISRFSKYLNIYGYPEELDYQDVVPIPEKFARVDAFIRDDIQEGEFKLPEEFFGDNKKLIFVSLGSMGSINVELMKRIMQILAKSVHKFIVSKGPKAAEYELPSNCWGQPFVPQTQILPLVDLVINHGGNNTVTETFSFGKPQIILPLFADQYDNAQRVEEKGYGARLSAHTCSEEQLLGTIDRLLNDREMIQKCQNAAQRIAKSNSKELVCKQIKQIVENNLQ